MGYLGSPHDDNISPRTYASMPATAAAASSIPPEHTRNTPRRPTSIGPCQRDLRAGLRRIKPDETTEEYHLKTMSLVHGAYESAAASQVIRLD